MAGMLNADIKFMILVTFMVVKTSDIYGIITESWSEFL